MTAAGILLCSPRDRLLFCLRSEDGWWATPGGGLEDRESPLEGALRELYEETRIDYVFNVQPLFASPRFVLYGARVPRIVVPQLDYEHTHYAWQSPDMPPAPLHPGLRRLWPHYAAKRKRQIALGSALMRLLESPAIPGRETRSFSR